MSQMPDPSAPPRVSQTRRKPLMFPPPEFPPRRPKLFARTPPAVFPVILGLLGLGLALRRALGVVGRDAGIADLLLGALVGLWGFAVLALLAKIARRPGVIWEDLRVMPGRAGLAAAAMGAMASSLALVPVMPDVALALLWLGLGAQVLLVALWLRLMWDLPREARSVDPGWHLLLTGSIVAGLPALAFGQEALAQGLFALGIMTATAVWLASAVQLLRRVPPAPLRPMLAIHLSPAALLSVTASGLNRPELALGFAVLSGLLFLALVVAGRWIAVAGRSPVWGAFTFPLTAFASALLALGGIGVNLGIGVLILALGLVPWIAWGVLSAWPGGKLAARTNAAEA